MKIFNDIELIDLAIYTNRTLIFTDFHIGYEEALNKQGLMVPRFQFKEIMARLEKIFLKLKGRNARTESGTNSVGIEKIVVNGDLKHEFGTISEQEWRNTLMLLDYFGQHCEEIVLIRGNHDAILGPIARKRNVKVLRHYLISPIIKKESKNKILVIHGNEIPDEKILEGVSTIIIGHEHPAVSVREGARSELFKAFLAGKWKEYNIIVQPSFNLVVEGTDALKEEALSPFLKGNLGKFEAIIAGDKLYRFGKLRNFG